MASSFYTRPESTAALSGWGAADIEALSSADLDAMKPSQFRAFTAEQLAMLKPAGQRKQCSPARPPRLNSVSGLVSKI